MAKRRLVPAALHSELTEYSSLLRALRTSNALDVASHIIKPRPYRAEPSLPVQQHDPDLEDENILQGDASTLDNVTSDIELPTIPQSRDFSPSRSSSPSEYLSNPSPRKRRRKSSLPPHQRDKRDTWTRWPLLAGDVHVPEWSLEDEIGLLAAQTLKAQHRPPLPTFQSEDNTDAMDDARSDDNDRDGDPPSYLPNLTNIASTYLSTILALLAAHTPNRPHSQQNRIEPIGWRTVLEVLSSCGDPSIANQEIISSVKSRMEAIYDASTTESAGGILAAQRIQLRTSAKEKLEAKFSQPMESLLDFHPPPAPAPAPSPEPGTPKRTSRKKRRGKIKSKKMIDD